MGCHTWFYKKVKNQPTDNDKISFCKDQMTRWLSRLETAIKDGGFKYPDNKKLEWYPYKNKKEVLKAIKSSNE